MWEIMRAPNAASSLAERVGFEPPHGRDSAYHILVLDKRFYRALVDFL